MEVAATAAVLITYLMEQDKNREGLREENHQPFCRSRDGCFPQSLAENKVLHSNDSSEQQLTTFSSVLLLAKLQSEVKVKVCVQACTHTYSEGGACGEGRSR